MNEPPHYSDNPNGHERAVLFALASSRFVTRFPEIILGYLLIDISLTFERSVGVMGLLVTSASSVTAVGAIFMGVVSLRVKHKPLLLLGLVFFSISAFGCTFAPSFMSMLIVYTISGIGLAMVAPMTYTLIAEHLATEKRAKAISWVLTSQSLASIIGAPVIGVISGMGGWRIAFLSLALPITLVSLIFAAKGLPPGQKPISTTSSGHYLTGFKAVFSNKSAMACLLGSVLATAAVQAIGLYSVSFIRERFLVSLEAAAILILGTAISSMLGIQLSGRVVNQLGRRAVTIIAAFIAGIFTIIYMNVVLNVWVVLALICGGSMFFGMMFTAAISLALEHVSEFRGTMMSLTAASVYLGAALGAGIGGVTLFAFAYEGVGIALGALSIAAAIIFKFFVTDPTSLSREADP